ncbi:hypothetical protein QOZ28_32070, partial [Pseudomonas aeruginosa]|uniref:hypothetical protein n=1 Tax=Pseudomonas aeruginosa TaxID=287 RepID=UPI003457CB75
MWLEHILTSIEHIWDIMSRSIRTTDSIAPAADVIPSHGIETSAQQNWQGCKQMCTKFEIS